MKLGQEGREAERGRGLRKTTFQTSLMQRKRKKITTRVNCEADGRDSRREIFEKRGRLKKKKRKKKILPLQLVRQRFCYR